MHGIITIKEETTDEPHHLAQLATNSDAPILQLEPWYFGNIDSDLAGNICKEDGDFLVRYSVNKQKYIISCRLKGNCHHCIVDVSFQRMIKKFVKLILHEIQQNDSGEFVVRQRTYKTMKRLLNFCVKRSIEINSKGVVLRQPVSKVDKWTMKNTDIEILNKFGSCSHFGEIGEALDKRSNQRVTAKSYVGTNPQSLNEFLFETEMLKLCHHLNITR